MKKRSNFVFGDKHDAIIEALSKQLSVSKTEVIKRAIELLAEKEGEKK